MLRALSGPLAGATFEVGPRLLIGRVAACDVHLVDVEVSREHAMIVTQDRQPTLVDLDSRNGTFMGGTRVRRAPLRAGDRFSVAGSEFIYDRAAPISTTPVLSARFGGNAPVAAAVRDHEGTRATRETVSVESTSEWGLASEERETLQSLAAVAVASSPAESVAAPRPTVRLEAATERRPDEKDTVEIRAAQAPLPDASPARASEFASRATTSLEAVAPPSEAVAPPSEAATSGPTPSFETPPLPPRRTVNANPTGRKRHGVDAYDGDLFADITAYRSFRFRLQLEEMPSGEEVAAMIDLEAELREPAETDPRRDVVTKRFFRRFPLVASLQARFTTSGRMVTAKGAMINLSADGLHCTLELGSYSLEPQQLVMLVIDHARNGVPVRYSVTARVVWSQRRAAGFVFAGVPSWSESRADFDEVETAVRAWPEPS